MRSRTFRRVRRILIAGSSLVILLLIGGADCQWIATRIAVQKHPAPRVLIDVGGHRPHIHNRGSGSPAVVIDAGLSGASYDWENVAAGIAKFTRVCAYDRAGYGWSDPGPWPETGQQAVSELRTLLQKADVKTPFILLGHSWGGINARLYASEYPDDIASLVLMDALNTDLVPDTEPPG